MSEQATFTISIGSGVETATAPANSSLRSILEERGVDLSNPVMVNGSPATLDSVVSEADVVTSSASGKGA